MARWYRAYEGTVTDSKLGEVALVAGCSRSVAIAAWHCILESACTAQSGGNFHATPRNVAVTLHEPIATVQAVFSELESLGMIEKQCVVAWKKRQYESDSSTARSRKHRANKVAKERNGDATLQQQHATPPDTEADTDTETEEEWLADANPARDDAALSGDAMTETNIAFQDFCSMADDIGLPKPSRLTPERRKRLAARLKEAGGLDGWQIAMAKIRGSPFLNGSKSEFRANFDFLLQKSSFCKIMEGNYDAHKPTGTGPGILAQFLAGTEP